MISASSGSRKSRIAAVPSSVSVDEKSVTTPSVTSWSSAWTSFVMPRDQDAGLVARVEADRQALEVREDPLAQVLQRALADPVDEVGLRVGGDPVDQRRGDERDQDNREEVGVALRGCRRRSRARRGRAARATRPSRSSSATNMSDDLAAVGPQQLEQAAQLARALVLAAQQQPEGADPRPHSPATSRSSGFSVRKTASGRPFSAISR